VELALAGGKQELARFAIARLLPVREARRELAARIAEVAASRDRLAERLDAQESELSALSTRVRARLSELQRERTSVPEPERPVADEEIELELLRRSRSPSGAAS
jgi:hypothetical protein